MNFSKVLIFIVSLMFMMIGVDKFLNFLEPPCSLMNEINPLIWKALGVLQIAAAILIWSPKFRKGISGFFMIFMIVFTIVHLSQGTRDVGGAAFMAVLLGVIFWNPSFLRGGLKTS